VLRVHASTAAHGPWAPTALALTTTHTTSSFACRPVCGTRGWRKVRCRATLLPADAHDTLGTGTVTLSLWGQFFFLFGFEPGRPGVRRRPPVGFGRVGICPVFACHELTHVSLCTQLGVLLVVRLVGAQINAPGVSTQPVLYLPLATATNNLGTAAAQVTTWGSVPFQTAGGKRAAYFSNQRADFLSIPYSWNTAVTISYWYGVVQSWCLRLHGCCVNNY
jgi:hypothetical protein